MLTDIQEVFVKKMKSLGKEDMYIADPDGDGIPELIHTVLVEHT